MERKNLPKSKTPYKPNLASQSTMLLLLPRDSEQVHVRLDVNVVRYRVDASEWICDLPVEVPD